MSIVCVFFRVCIIADHLSGLGEVMHGRRATHGAALRPGTWPIQAAGTLNYTEGPAGLCRGSWHNIHCDCKLAFGCLQVKSSAMGWGTLRPTSWVMGRNQMVRLSELLGSWRAIPSDTKPSSQVGACDGKD